MIDPRESIFIGHWPVDGSSVIADEMCQHIELLVANHLIELIHSADGWSTLFRDPTDDRLWERTYPQAKLHGGGPATLRCVSLAQARATYDYEI
jgi:hypothetical protein